MIDEVREMLEEKMSLEREYLELIHISDKMNLPIEMHDKMIMANIAHSLAVVADTLAGRKIEPQTEERTTQGTGDCEHCSRLFVDCDGR